jgi:ribosomal protein S19
MCRSLWKLYHNDLFVFIRSRLRKHFEERMLTKNRHQSVYPFNKNEVIKIYDGKKYISIRFVNNKYYFHKFGEFSLPIIMSSLLHKKKSKTKKK